MASDRLLLGSSLARLMTAEISLEEVVEERQFAGILQTHAELFFRLTNTLAGSRGEAWNKRHYFQLIHEADTLESFLDDYGGRFNQTYAYFTELVASVRGFALAGYSIAHLVGRMATYGATNWIDEEYREAYDSLQRVSGFLAGTVLRILEGIRAEARILGVEITPEGFPEGSFLPVVTRRRLPRNLGEAELIDEEQKIAEVSTKYLRACEALARIGIRSIEDPAERRQFASRYCTEERARTYEATIHNLQSTYDTHIQNTVLERQDQRLPLLRAHVSASLHLLEAVTHLTHFVERHEDEVRSEETKSRIGAIVTAADVQEVIVNELLVWVNRHMQSGAPIAEELLPSYTNVQELVVDLADGLTLHARPAALLVRVVTHYGTPVQLEIADKRCNAASILEILVAVGSHPGTRRLVFHGDERPLRDIRLLVEHDLGENGTDAFPDELHYLRG